MTAGRIATHFDVTRQAISQHLGVLRGAGLVSERRDGTRRIYRVNITGHERVSGEVIEIVPHRRLVFTWGWEDGALPVAPGQSTVEISLEPDGDGTRLRLTHRDLPPDMHSFHRIGWDYALPRLATVAAGRDPGPDPLRSIVRGTLMVARSLAPRYLYRLGRRRLRQRARELLRRAR